MSQRVAIRGIIGGVAEIMMTSKISLNILDTLYFDHLRQCFEEA